MDPEPSVFSKLVVISRVNLTQLGGLEADGMVLKIFWLYYYFRYITRYRQEDPETKAIKLFCGKGSGRKEKI